MTFSTDYQYILRQVEAYDPTDYARTRNHVDGEVSRLSPYISRGVISTRMVKESLERRGYDGKAIQKFIQELAWRDYWQEVWSAKGEAIDKDLKHPQKNVEHHGMPLAILRAQTGIEGVDNGIRGLYETGYMHNHVRMYTAAIACNMGHTHWYTPAKWMYYHLLDGDLASNALGWQWVAGSNADKKYIADQRNVNRFTGTSQRNTFIDIPYSEIADMSTPDVLRERIDLDLHSPLPSCPTIKTDGERTIYLYNWYNLDPAWADQEDAQRILLIEPSVFERYPISAKSMVFMMTLSENIPGMRSSSENSPT